MIEVIFILLLASFIMEMIDSGLGMMYGTLLTPILILAGYNPIYVVPSILLSQSLGGFIATVRHHKLDNANFSKNTMDSKIASVMIALGGIAVIIGAYIGSIIPTFYLKVYIATLCVIMGSIIIAKAKFVFSWLKISVISILSAFNKALSGGGFGPIVASGQIASGIESKKAIGITDFAEAPICLMSFIAWLVFNGYGIPNELIIPLCIGAGAGGFVGPYLLSKFKSKRLLTIIVGTLAVVSGLYMMYKLF